MHHHPDLRWTILVTVLITSAVVGSLLYWPLTVARQVTATDTADADTVKSIQALHAEIENLKQVNQSLQTELKARATTSAVVVTSTTFPVSETSIKK